MQAILITAYKNQDYLKKLIRFFSIKYKVYVHLDKKSKIQRDSSLLNKNVTVIKKYIVNWGGLNHLLAILDLLEMALSDEQVKYIHIISGQDIPVKPLADFSNFEDDSNIYMECNNVNDIKNPKIKWRYTIGTMFPNMDNRKKWIQIINYFHNIGNRRNKIDNFVDIYKGLVWCSFPASAGKYILKYCNNEKFMQEWKRITIPEEFFFQTILKNSNFSSRIKNNNLRYNDWHYRNGSEPAFLDTTDIKKIEGGNYFFARKIDPKISAKLIDKYLR